MLSDCWDTLANYESFELVKRDYQARHGRTPNVRHAREIAAPFSHARSYFRAAHAAEPTVKPLLLYYGVVSLSRGLTLALSRGLREAALAASHGLSVREWGQELSRDNPDFAVLQIEVNAAGTFLELANATQFQSLLRSNSSAVNTTVTNPPMPPGSVFSLGDLVSRFPALQEHHMRWRNETWCAGLDIENPGGGEIHLKLFRKGRPWVTRDFSDAMFQGTEFTFVEETPERVIFKGPDDINAVPGFTDHVNLPSFNVGNLWLTALYPGGVRISKIMALFALSYNLGMLVRYYPMQWTALIRGQIDDSALPTLSSAVDLLEREYPKVVVDFLNQS